MQGIFTPINYGEPPLRELLIDISGDPYNCLLNQTDLIYLANTLIK